MLEYSLIAVAIVVLLFVVIVATRPADFRIARSAVISAPPSAVFERVNDHHNWTAWSPWAKLDPDMKETYEGPPAGVGSIHTWNGNNKVGQGRSTITESVPGELVGMRLEFLRPFACTNAVQFTFTSQGDGTLVTWAMTGRNNFMAKAFGLFMSFDKMIGSDFEKGLAALKTLLESAPKTGSTV